MNKVGMLLDDLHEAEAELAAELRVVSERQATEHDVHYMCQTLAKQCDEHLEWIEGVGKSFGVEPSHRHAAARLPNVLAGIRHKTAELLGRRPEAGLLLLRDLRQLYLLAQEVNVHWLAMGQVAQGLRDHQLLDEVTVLHKQTVTQIKWCKTRLKEATPQVLLVAT